MLSDRAAADNWNAWLDDLPLDAGFAETGERLQDFISGLVAAREAAERERDAWKAQADATASEAWACFGAQDEIDEAWDAIGTRGNKAALSLSEQIASLMRELDDAELSALKETPK